MSVFHLKLQKTYHDKGFFNVGVDYDTFVRKTDGPVRLQLGRGGPFIQAKVNRTANTGGTPRILGGVPLRDWFFRNFEPMDVVNVDLTSLDVIVLEPSGEAIVNPTGKVEAQKPVARKPAIELRKPTAEPLLHVATGRVKKAAPPRTMPALAKKPEAETDQPGHKAPSLSLSPFIRAFAQKVGAGEIEIYNEFSLQHELGIYLRHQLVGCKVQFERNVTHFDYAKSEFEKKEIDITVTLAGSADRVGVIELKYPRNGQIPETMYSFCKDIVFLEQLVASGFHAGYFLAVVDDPLFYQGSQEGIYALFRGGRHITGVVTKPTGAQDSKLTIAGSYSADWQPIKGRMKFCLIEIRKGAANGIVFEKDDGVSESVVDSGVDSPITFGARKPIGLAKDAILPNVYAPWGKSKLHIEAAHFHLASMKRSPGRVEFELAFRGFVDAIYAFWNAFSKADGVAASPQFVTWLTRPIQDKKTDEVLQYLVGVRNKYQHDPLFKLQWTESKVQITSREGSMTLQGLRIFPDGTFEPKARSSAGGNATVDLLENPGDPVLPTIIDTRSKPPKTYMPPQFHLGEPVNGTDPREIAALGLAYYEQCLQEAMGRFG